MAELDVKKMVNNKPGIKRVEIEYKDMNYIIINLEENVIDVNGELWEFKITKEDRDKLEEMLWTYEDLDEYDYWPDKSKDHAPMSPIWRLAFYDEFDTYYRKSGTLKYPDNFMDIVKFLKNLK